MIPHPRNVGAERTWRSLRRQKAPSRNLNVQVFSALRLRPRDAKVCPIRCVGGWIHLLFENGVFTSAVTPHPADAARGRPSWSNTRAKVFAFQKQQGLCSASTEPPTHFAQNNVYACLADGTSRYKSCRSTGRLCYDHLKENDMKKRQTGRQRVSSSLEDVRMSSSVQSGPGACSRASKSTKEGNESLSVAACSSSLSPWGSSRERALISFLILLWLIQSVSQPASQPTQSGPVPVSSVRCFPSSIAGASPSSTAVGATAIFPRQGTNQRPMWDLWESVSSLENSRGSAIDRAT